MRGSEIEGHKHFRPPLQILPRQGSGPGTEAAVANFQPSRTALKDIFFHVFVVRKRKKKKKVCSFTLG